MNFFLYLNVFGLKTLNITTGHIYTYFLYDFVVKRNQGASLEFCLDTFNNE